MKDGVSEGWGCDEKQHRADIAFWRVACFAN